MLRDFTYKSTLAIRGRKGTAKVPFKEKPMQEHCNEEWRVIPGSEGYYEASSEGRIRSVAIQTSSTGRKRGRVLSPKPHRRRKGYLCIRFCVPGAKKKSATVHQSVALTFIGPVPEGCQVNHKDGNKENNRPGNLEYVTVLENIRHSWETGLHKNDCRKGESNREAKLTEEDVRTIRAIYPAKSLTELAVMFGVTNQAISFVVKRKTWTHI